jgi:hypothetical protein
MVRSLVLHQSSNDDKVIGLTITTAPATQPYTGTSIEMVEKGSSPRRWWHSALTQTNGSEVVKDLWAQLLRCTNTPQGLVAQRRTLPAMRSSRQSTHRWQAEVTHVICSGQRTDWPMMPKPRAKGAQGSVDRMCVRNLPMAEPIDG